ncbi:MAG: sigma 54-interacting transcriptional regulator [Desulfobacterales bacterium]
MTKSENDLISELREQLEFETLLREISTHFVNLPAERIDDAIRDAQRRICEYLDLDRSALWQFSGNEAGGAFLTHIQQLPEAPLPSESLDAGSSFPWLLEQVQRKGIVAISRLADLPPEADCDRESFKRWGTRSSVVVPLYIGDRVAGALSFARLQREGDWPVHIVERFVHVAQVFTNALVRKQAEETVKERLEFESLMSSISACFVNLPAEQIDGAIEDAQRQVCQCLGLDLSVLWQWSAESPRFFTLTHLHSPPEGPTRPERIDAQESFPWVFQKMLRGETLVLSTENMPPEACRDQESRRFYGVQSSVIIPLSTGGGPLIGVLDFDTLKEERSWSKPHVKRLQLVAQVFANALARKYAEQDLRKSENRLSLAADSAEAGLWELDCHTDLFWTTGQARTIFGFGPREVISMERFEAAVHPDDLELVRKAIHRALGERDSVNAEYRILTDDGRVKWIASRGRTFFNPTGEPDRLMGVSIDITDRKHMESALKEQLEEIEKLKSRLENENVYLRKELRMEKGFEEIVGESKVLKAVTMAAKQVATTDATVLLLGETGTGKGMIAYAIHQLSARQNRPLVTVNCSALPQNLIESELFGREKGAFTGAHARQAGRFEVADGGTIFLDEIGEMPLELQSKLLRVLQEGEFERLGSAQTIKVDVRVIAATSRDLRQEVRARRFREDLYYRLNVFPIPIPPLRQRTEDIPLLAQYFTNKYARKMDKLIEGIPKATLKAFIRYNWPGNVRELEHVIERGVILTPGTMLKMTDQLIPLQTGDSNDNPLKDLAAAEREHILRVLRETGWRINGPSGAAAILKLHPSTLRFRIKKLGIRRPV